MCMLYSLSSCYNTARPRLFMKDITPILSSLGLLDSEIKTYLGALENGPSSAQDLAKINGLSRQATYVAIESLTKRGLMSSVMRGKKRFYAAESPEKLLTYAKQKEWELKQKVKDLEATLPELEMQAGGERPVVRMFEGKQGLRAIIKDKKKTKHDHLMEISDLDALYKVLTPEDLRTLRQGLDKRKVKIDGLYVGTPGKKVISTSHRTMISDEYAGFASDISIYGNKVSLTTFVGKMYSVIIESEPIAKGLEVLFELALKGAKKEQKNTG